MMHVTRLLSVLQQPIHNVTEHLLMSRQTAYVADTQPLLPDAVYPLEAWIRCSGITRARMRDARQAGIELKIREVGKRRFVFGRDGNDFILRLAELTEAGAAQ